MACYAIVATISFGQVRDNRFAIQNQFAATLRSLRYTRVTRKLNRYGLFGGEVEKAGEALLAGEGVDAGEVALEAIEIGLPFHGEEDVLAAGAALMAALGDAGGAECGVHRAEKMKASL